MSTPPDGMLVHRRQYPSICCQGFTEHLLVIIYSSGRKRGTIYIPITKLNDRLIRTLTIRTSRQPPTGGEFVFLSSHQKPNTLLGGGQVKMYAMYL